MGFYNGIYVNNTLVHHIRNWVTGPELDYLFVDIPVRALTGTAARPFATNWRLFGDDPPDLDEETFVVQIQARQLRNRLDALGFGEQVLREALEHYEQERHESAKRLLMFLEDELAKAKASDPPRSPHSDSDFDEWANIPKASQADLEEDVRAARHSLTTFQAIDFDTWVEEIRHNIKTAPRKYVVGHKETPMLPFDDYADVRVVLAAIVAHVPDDKVITLDVTDEGGDRSRIETDQSVAWVEPSSWDLGHEPAIVITEGSFDAKALGYGLRLLHPHLMPYIRFFEHDLGVEGGAGAAIRTLKSFTAAGVRNRVIALLDNDSAAHEAASALRRFKLPEHFAVLHYPDLKFAKKYPTLGPQGNTVMDVNGLAGSIELYLGVDVLVDGAEAFSPVQWKGMMSGIGRYQGELIDKARIQKRFLAKAKALEGDPDLHDSQDWSGITAIIETLLRKLSGLPGSGLAHIWNR